MIIGQESIFISLSPYPAPWDNAPDFDRLNFTSHHMWEVHLTLVTPQKGTGNAQVYKEFNIRV